MKKYKIDKRVKDIFKDYEPRSVSDTLMEVEMNMVYDQKGLEYIVFYDGEFYELLEKVSKLLTNHK